MNDSLIKSLFTGRVGAGLLALGGAALSYFGYTATPEDQNAMVMVATQGVALVSGALALFSKIKSTKQ